METTGSVFHSWIEAFQAHDPEAIASWYHEEAINWQVADEPVVGRTAIEQMMRSFFTAFPDVYTHVESILIDGEWASWEWVGGGTFKNNLGTIEATGRSFEIRGCGFFHIVRGRIVLQRGYWDRASWYDQIGVPLTSNIK